MAANAASDAFQDFFSPDDDGDAFDDDYLSFSDEQIANVLDLMTEGSMARLDAVFQDVSKTGAETCETTAQCSTTELQQPPCNLKAQRNQEEQHKDDSADNSDKVHTQPREQLVQSDEDDAKVPTHHPGTSLEYTTYRSEEQLPLALGLLEELFPPPAPSDALASSTDLLELDIPPRDEDRRQGEKDTTAQEAASSNPERQPDWMSLLDELYGNLSETQSEGAVTPLNMVNTGVSSNSFDFDDGILPTKVNVSSEEKSVRKDSELWLDSSPSIDPVQMFKNEAFGAVSISSSLDGNQSCPSSTWGKFSPDIMPIRQSLESFSLVGSDHTSTGKDRKKVYYVPLHRQQKCCLRAKVKTPADLELTFRPKINTGYLKRLRSRRRVLSEDFSRRMEKDILKRERNRLEREKEKEKQKEQAAKESRRASLVAKGSELILHKNGLWEEPLEKRLERLTLGIKSSRDKRANEKGKKQQRKKNQRAAATASRACESLYQRGLNKKLRDQTRQDEHLMIVRRNSAWPKMNPKSHLVIKKKLRHDLELVCCGSQRSHSRKTNREPNQKGEEKWLTFVEFSCALLYFGLVPDLETPLHGDDQVTLLWHAWKVFAKDDRDGQEKMTMNTLESILGTVILGNKKVPNSSGQQQEELEREQELLKLFRVHYLSRKRPGAINFQKIYQEESDGRRRKDPAQTFSATSRQPQPKYTLHGKLVTRSIAQDPLSLRERASQQKVRELRREKEELEVAECTFRPQINRSPSSTWSCDLNLMSTYGRQYKSNATKSTFDRLYHDAVQRQNNVLEKYFQAKLEEEEQQKKEAAISASYVNGLTIEERLQNLQAALARNPLPVDFYKKIETMRSATETKAQEMEEKAKKLLPVQFQKSKTGQTIVVPFQFATEIRASSHSDRRATHGKESKKKTRELVRRAMNQFRNESRPECSTELPKPTTATTPTSDEESANTDFCFDVHLSPSRIQRLYFNAGDNPAQVAASFTRRHRLNKDQEICLVEVLEANLEKLVNLQL